MENFNFTINIIRWYDHSHRELPWRGSASPYHIWISEIILQQTQIKQGLSYYLRFIGAFPDVQALAGATEDEVLKYWQGLGYYTRALNLHRTAKIITQQHMGVFPQNSRELVRLPGIGPYTAAAMASILSNEVIAAIDGNVFRVLARHFDISTPIDSLSGKKLFSDLANQLVDHHRPGDFNQAMMDLGALICTPKKPQCGICPIQTSCLSNQNKKWSERPVKSKKNRMVTRYLYYICIESKTQLILVKRDSSSIWKNLYEFPLIETEERQAPQKILETQAWRNIWGPQPIVVSEISGPVHHQLTHQKLELEFIRVELPAQNNFPENFLIIDKKNIFDFPVPNPVRQFLIQRIT